MSTYAFDIEIFPNFFSAIFINVEDEFDEECFLVYKDRNDLAKLREFINREITLVGYNNLYFDNVILNYLLDNYQMEGWYNSDQIKAISKIAQDIITLSEKKLDTLNTNERKRVEVISKLRNKKVPYKSIDFKEMIGLDISLKQAIIVLEWVKIQELPYPPDTKIIDEYMPQILSYNRNDILPLIKMWQELQTELNLRAKVNEVYRVDVSNKSEGQIPNVIFEKLYSQATNQQIKAIKELRTPRDSLLVDNCIAKNICFNTSRMNGFIEQIKEVDLIKEGFETHLDFAGLTFNLGEGGIHTQDAPGIFCSDNDCFIVDADVTSFYPFVILNNSFKPNHLDYKFLEIYQDFVNQRIEAKAKKDKVIASILKIVILAPFGKFNKDNYWFYDPKAFYSVTISGQLYLLSLVEDLMLKDIEVISANTDGIVCKVKQSQKDIYFKTCKLWEEKVNFELDFTHYQKYIRRDVNNYVCLKTDSEVKRRGIFATKEDVTLYKRFQKSYTPDIIPQALTNYFIYDIPVEETLRKSKNIFDFMMSKRNDKTFEIILRKGQTEEPQQRVNRYYACIDGGTLIKRDRVVKGNQSIPREISILSGVQVQIANDIDKKRPFESYKVDLNWYQSEVEKIIRTIEVEQLQLF